MRTVVTGFAVCGLIAAMLYGCMVDATDRRLRECEAAFERWTLAPEGEPQPSILTEDWCFDHLTQG